MVGPPEDTLWLQLRQSLVPGRTRPSVWRRSSVLALPSAATPALVCAGQYRPQHQERGSSSPSSTRPGPLGGRSAQGADYGHILVAATPVGECPGTMVIAARCIVKTSDKGGCHGASLAIRHGFSYSTYSSLISSAHMFMLPLEAMGPGGSLSTSLATTFNGETPVVECPGRRHGDGGIQLRPDGARSSARGS